MDTSEQNKPSAPDPSHKPQPSQQQPQRRPLAPITNNVRVNKAPPSHAPKKTAPSQPTRPIQRIVVVPRPQTPLARLPPSRASDPNRELTVSDHFSDIYSYLLEHEKTTTVQPGFLAPHAVNPRNRTLLVNWIVEVHEKFKFVAETLHLTVHLIDRFFAARPVPVHSIQLMGVACLLIASKYEEELAPDIDDLVHFTCETYMARQIVDMEKEILCTLSFDLSHPHSISFLRWLSIAESASPRTDTLAQFFVETALLEHTLSSVPPSHVAAAALCLASHLQDDPVDAESVCRLVSLSLATLDDVGGRISLATVKLLQSTRMVAVKEKWARPEMGRASVLNQRQVAWLRALARE